MSVTVSVVRKSQKIIIYLMKQLIKLKNPASFSHHVIRKEAASTGPARGRTRRRALAVRSIMYKMQHHLIRSVSNAGSCRSASIAITIVRSKHRVVGAGSGPNTSWICPRRESALAAKGAAAASLHRAPSKFFDHI